MSMSLLEGETTIPDGLLEETLATAGVPDLSDPEEYSIIRAKLEGAVHRLRAAEQEQVLAELTVRRLRADLSRFKRGPVVG